MMENKMTEHRAEKITLIDEIVSEAGWDRLSEGVAARPDFDPRRETPGSLVFDVDGVLIDTHHSFREVIPRAVNCYVESVLGLIGSVHRMQIDDGEMIKKAGGFNDDWDVAEAGLIFALWHYYSPWTAPTLATLTRDAAAAGGGIGAMKDLVRVRLGDTGAREIMENVDRDLLVRICREFYMGENIFREIYGEDLQYHQGEGGMSRERPLVAGEIWEAARQLPYGIFTGRIPEEMRMAADLLGLPEQPGSETMICDDGRFPLKPDPAGLVHLARQLDSRPLCYFGDNRDDLTALLSARRHLEEEDLHFVCCLTGASDPESVQWFSSSGAVMIAAGVEDALSVLLPSS